MTLKIITTFTFNQLEEEVNNFMKGKNIRWIKFTDLVNEMIPRKTAYILYDEK